MSDKNQNRLGTWSQRTVAKNAAYAIQRDDDLILVDTTAGGVTVTLPNPQADIVQAGLRFRIMKTAAGNTLTIAAAGSIPIVGPTSLTGLNQWAECLTDGTHWFVFAS